MNEPLEVGRVPLAGHDAVLYRARAPIAAHPGARLTWFLEGVFGVDDKPDMFVTPVAKGLLEDVARNDFAWAEVDGEVVTTAWTMTPHNEPRLATLGEVYTDPAWRGNRLAGAVCQVLLDRFDQCGGRVIFLGTGEEAAARIYARLGFVPHPQGLMRRERPLDGDFEREWFAPSAVAVRPITWGDTPRLVALYAARNDWASTCWMQGLYSATYVTHDRCNSLVKHTWQATRPGAWLGLFSAGGALVGSGPMEPRGNEKEVVGADVDLFVHPAFQELAGALLDAMAAEGRRLGWRWLRAELPAFETAKRAALERAGFREVGRVSAAISIGGSVHDVVVMRLTL